VFYCRKQSVKLDAHLTYILTNTQITTGDNMLDNMLSVKILDQSHVSL